MVLQHALHQTFWAVLIISAAAFATALLVPHVALGRAREVPAE